MKVIFTFIEKLLNSIKYNGFYIFLSLIFPFIIFKLDAGSQIIVSMTEKQFGLNLALSILTFTTIGFSIWCVPTLAIKLFQFFVYRKSIWSRTDTDLSRCLYDHLIIVYNGTNEAAIEKADINTNLSDKNLSTSKLQLSVRYFAIAPWGLFVITCVKVICSDWWKVAGVGLILIFVIFIINKFKDRIVAAYEFFLNDNKNKFSEARYKLLIILSFVAVLIFSFIFYKIETQLEPLKWLLILLNTLGFFSLYSFLVYSENAKIPPAIAYKISNLNYKVLLVFLVLAIIIFYWLNVNQLIEFLSPIIVIITLASALIIFFELFFTAQLLLLKIIAHKNFNTNNCLVNQKPVNETWVKGYRFILLGLIAWVIMLYFFSSANSHRIRKINISDYSESAAARPSLETYFTSWLNSRNITADDSVVYIVSGQGGGSRAAAHFFMTMALLDSANPDFFKKTFALSTVSGSTTGANMYLATRFYNINLSGMDIQNKTAELYGRNYMSSAFFGLMLGDGIESILDVNKDFPRDRNYHLQKEELAAFERAFRKDSLNFIEGDFLQPYTKNNIHFPLFIINSTPVSFGTRGVFSPVDLGDISLATDLYGAFKKDPANKNFGIPMVACVNQSQAFPILSSYNYIYSVGRLGDGGISENTGCATTRELYQALRAFCNKTSRTHVRIICINLTTSDMTKTLNADYEKASILNTVSAAVNSPFSGSQTYAYKNLSKEMNYLKQLDSSINKRDTVINFSLDTSITLTRTLSDNAVRRMYDVLSGRNYNLKSLVP